MTGLFHLGALVAIVPAMLGPPHGSTEMLALTMCGGGALTIEIPPERVPAPEGKACSEGCHSSCSRKRIDRAQ